ncbi:MAG: inositol monophosphatase [Rickettsiaceae bacterium]
MEGEIGLIVDATRQASRFLLRDYFELETLQTSNRSSLNFSQKSCTRVSQVLQERLTKYFNTVIFDSQEVDKVNFTGKAVLVETIDGYFNLTRSLPFFAIMVTVVVRKDDKLIAEKSVMNFPALGEIYYVEKGKGAWLERHASNFPGATRLRVSGTEEVKDAIISTPLSLIELAKPFQGVRIFESCAYSLAQLIAGKIDIIIAEPSNLTASGVQLFTEEAAGACQTHGQRVVASNFKLTEKIKQLFS